MTPSRALAFKFETHVWIAQQVLNDLATCRIGTNPCVTIELTDPVTHDVTTTKLLVDPGLVASLEQFPKQFRMGAIGPDGFPDLVGGQLTTHPGVAGHWQADDWLKWIVSGAAAPHFEPAKFTSPAHWEGTESQAFAYGYLTHAAGDIFAHSYVNTYAGDIFLLSDGEQEVEARHILLEAFIKNYDPPLTDHTGQDLGSVADLVSVPVPFVSNRLLRDPTAAAQYGLQGPTGYLAAMYDFWKRQGDLLERIDGAIAAIDAKISSFQSSINSLKNAQVCTPRICILGHCTPRTCFNIYPAYCVLDPGTCLAVNATQETLDEVKDAVGDMGANIRTPVSNAHDKTRQAIDEYIRTSQNVVKELMTPDGDATGELLHWVECWTPAFAGISDVVSQTSCVPIQLLRSAHDAIKAVCDKLDALGVFGDVVVPMCPVQEFIENEVENGLATSISAAIVGQNSLFTSLVRLRTEGGSEAALEEEFTVDNSSKHLLFISHDGLTTDIAERVVADMHVVSGHFDPATFNPVYNAIQLAKLTLVGPAELNRLVTDAQITDTIYGPLLYTPTSPFNVLFGAVRSLDGNQQWQEAAIPYPRHPPNAAQLNQTHANYPYGYAYAGGASGLRLWQDCEVRESVFERMFKGPIAPGLEQPSLVNLTDILGEDDPNRMLDDPFRLAEGSHLPTKWDRTSLPATFVCGDRPIIEFIPRLNPNPQPVVDATAPTLTAPPDVAAECVTRAATEVSIGSATAVDNRDPNPAISNDAPAVFPFGRTVVTWTAVDTSGNVATTPQNVTVVDTIGPAFGATPAPLTFTATNPEGTSVSLTPPAATDACDGSVVVSPAAPLEPLEIGTHTIVWRAVDMSGNSADVRQEITIRALPGDVDVDGDVDNADLDEVVATLGTSAGPVPRDYNGDGAVDAIDEVVFDLLRTGADPRDLDHSGTIDLADARLLVSSCTPAQCWPVVLCPADLTVSNDPGAAGAAVTFSATVVAAEPNLPFSSSKASGSFFSIGTSHVVVQASDGAGAGSCGFDVTVVDTEPPHVSAPPDVIAEATSPAGAVVADGLLGVPVATDNAPGVSLTRAGVPASNVFPLGTTTVTYTARDGAGNTAAAAQQVGVRDTTPPSIAIAMPRSTSYTLHQTVASQYTCTDAVSPIAKCDGTVPSGSNIDTAHVGPSTFTVAAADSVGNGTSQSIAYTVAYAICSLFDASKAAKSGSTLPIKIQMCDAAGANQSSLAVAVNAGSIRKLSDATTSDVIDAGNANPDLNFRFDPALGGTGGYVFNLKTTGLASGTYALTFIVGGDPTPHEVTFVVR